MCEAFARQRLKVVPPDIGQRIANGLNSTLSVLNDPCGGVSFGFQRLLSSNHPTANLPVLFSSRGFMSPDIEVTAVTKNNPPAPQQMLEYWYGAGINTTDTLCSRSTTACYDWGPNGAWRATELFRSVPGVCLYLGPNQSSVMVKKGTVPTVLSASRPVQALQMSGNGEKYFLKDNVGWQRHTSGINWQYVGQSGTNWNLTSSFDGTQIILTDPKSRLVCYIAGTSTVRVSNLPLENPGNHPVYAAALDRLFFIVRGRDVYSTGSLGTLVRILEFDNLTFATGIFTDEATVWIPTNRGTFMSNDGGVSWVEQKDVFAVGPGLYTTKDSPFIWKTSETPFAQAVEFPLRLNNGGRLYSPVSGWTTWFEDKTMTDAFTTVEEGTPATLSPNGLYLLTQNNGLVTLYLNVWNFGTFPAWCKLNRKECNPAYGKYCELYKDIDRGCKTETPGNGDNEESDKSTLKTVLTILGVLAGLAVLAAAIYFVWKQSKGKFSSPESTASLPSLTN
jgi:hypothetical protein